MPDAYAELSRMRLSQTIKRVFEKAEKISFSGGDEKYACNNGLVIHESW
jgi:hypothetical protein